MKHIFKIFAILCLFSGQILAQSPAAKVLQFVFPQSLFDLNYGNEVFRNKFVPVEVGSDTVIYFVDINGVRALMVSGASGGGGDSTINVESPLEGDGLLMSPVKWIDGVHPGDIWAWDSIPGQYVLYPFPINIYTGNGTLQGHRTVTGNSKDLTFTGVRNLVLAATTSLSEGASSGNAELYSLFGDVRLTAGDSIFAEAQEVVKITADSIQLVGVPTNFTGEKTFVTQSPLGFLTKQEGIDLVDLNFAPTNIYNSDGTLAANRTLSGGGNSLTEIGLSGAYITAGEVAIETDADNMSFVSAGTFGVNSQGDNMQTVISGTLSLNASDNSININSAAGIDILSQNSYTLTFGDSGGAASGIVTDNSANADGLEGSDDYCAPDNDLAYAQIGCVKLLISDSISGLGLPPGSTNETLRYYGTNLIKSDSTIFNNGSKVSIGTQIFDSRYVVNVLGDLRVNNQGFFGNAVGRSFTGAVLGTNDSTGAASHVYFSNRSSTTNDHMDLTLLSNEANSDSRYHALSTSGEAQANWGWNTSEGAYVLSLDPAASLDIERVFTAITGGNIGIQDVTAPTAQIEFTASVDEDATSYPIKFRAGSLLDSPSDGGLNYVNEGANNNMYITSNATDFILGKCLFGSATIDFGALAVLATESQPVTVTGAVAGDQCILGNTATHIDGVVYTCEITAANTARVTVLNATTGAVNPTSGTFNVRAFH